MTRARPTQLQSDQDLLEDQRRFFRENGAPDPQDQPSIPPTPTSSLLPPIKERKVTRRTRRTRPRAAPSLQAFPPIPTVSPDSQSVYGRQESQLKAQQASAATTRDRDDSLPVQQDHANTGSSSSAPAMETSTNALSANSDGSSKSFSRDARSAFEAMSLEEIQDAQRELFGTLDDSSLQFLKDKWSQRGIGSDSNVMHTSAKQPATASSGSNTAAFETSAEANETPAAPSVSNTAHSVSFQVPGDVNNSGRSMLTAPNRNLKNEAAAEQNIDSSDKSNLPGTALPPGIVEITEQRPEEKEKTAWMADAATPLPSDADLDRTLATAIKAIGPIANARFNLSGHILTPEQIASLPTHLALHHHGTSPASAGYTLPDILTLLRSTVVTQRVIALNMLTALVTHHREDVFPALISSEALSLAFNPFSSPSAFHSSLTNQIAYVDALDALVVDQDFLGAEHLVRDRYFASRFYSQPLNPAPPSKLIESLSQSDCVSTLLRIGISNVSSPRTMSTALRALVIVRAFVVACPSATTRIVEDDSAIPILLNLASASAMGTSEEDLGKHPASAVLLACDILAHVIVSETSPDGSPAQRKLKETVLTDRVVERVCGLHLSVLIGQVLRVPGSLVLHTAMGALRLVRACLSRAVGIIAFSKCVQAACVMARKNSIEAVEALLTLEAFVHSMHQVVLRPEIESDGEKANTDPKQDDVAVVGEAFVKDHLSHLVPEALSAGKVFSHFGASTPLSIRAAAGHFAASVFAIYRVPLDSGFFAALLACCTDAGKELLNISLTCEAQREQFYDIASISHAGARLLQRLDLNPGYLQREVNVLFEAIEKEKKYINTHPSMKEWKPAANCCAEWVCLLPRYEKGIQPVKRAAEILEVLSDPQVIVDVVSRCILRLSILRSMNPELSEKEAQKCAEILIPLTFDALSGQSEKESDAEIDENGNNPNKKVDIRTPRGVERRFSLPELLKTWLKEEPAVRSALSVASAFLKASVINASVLMRLILHANPVLHEEHGEGIGELLFDCMQNDFKNDCYFSLAEEDTVVSSVSTSPNSRVVDSLLSLSDVLVQRGPAATGYESTPGACDRLATVLFVVMTSKDVDISLRVSMWKKTIDDCGGAALYTFASPYSDHQQAEQRLPDTEEDAILRTYCTTIARGFLSEKRCPQPLANLVISSLHTRTNAPGSVEVLGPLIQCYRSESFVRSFQRFESVLPQTSITQNGFQALMKWLSSQV